MQTFEISIGTPMESTIRIPGATLPRKHVSLKYQLSVASTISKLKGVTGTKMLAQF